MLDSGGTEHSRDPPAGPPAAAFSARRTVGTTSGASASPRRSAPACLGQKLYDAPDGAFRLLLAQYPPNTPTAIHSHEGWVIIGLLEGSERYTSWRRVDDGSTSKAELELVQDHHIMAGEFGYLYDGPLNVHRQGAEAGGAVELVLMKGRGQRLEHIDGETGECSAPVELNR